jgi:hypothetical protein
MYVYFSFLIGFDDKIPVKIPVSDLPEQMLDILRTEDCNLPKKLFGLDSGLFIWFIKYVDIYHNTAFSCVEYLFPISLLQSYVNMRLIAFSAATLFIAGVFALPTPDDHVVHEQRRSLSRAWSKLSKISQDETTPVLVPVRIGLKQGNIDRAHELLMEV